MPYQIQFDIPPSGVAASSAREGDRLAVTYREFTSSEDGDTFISRLEGLPSTILRKIEINPPIKPSTIDHLVALIDSKGKSEVYINELSMTGKARIRKNFEKGGPVLHDDLIDIQEIHFKGIEIPPHVGVLILISHEWRKGLFFDFGPILPSPIERDFSISHLLGSFYSYLTFQHYFKITDKDWDKLLATGWFPFIGLNQDTLASLITSIRNDWDPDKISASVTASIKTRIQNLKENWSQQPLLNPHFQIFSHALDRFAEDDYISTTAMLYPKIEGLLRGIQTQLGGTSFKQAHLAQAPGKSIEKFIHSYSRLLPNRFREFLEKVYFASFQPNQTPTLSRNSIAHGVAPAEAYSMKSAALGILIIEQLCFHLPPPNDD